METIDERPPGPPLARGKSALAFYAVLLALFPLALLAQWASAPLGLAATQLFAFLLPAVIATVGSNLRVRPYLRLRAPGPLPVVLGALAGGAAYLVAGAVMTVTQRLLPRGWVELFDVGRIFEGPAWERAALAVVAVAVAPVCEEIAFRGYLQSTLALRLRPALAVPAGAFLFATLHLDPVRFPALVVLGSLFGWLTWRAGSVWPAVAAHATNNLLAMLLLLSRGAADAATSPPGAVAPPLALGAASLAVLAVAYRAAAPPPEPAGTVVLRDPASPSIAWHPSRVPPPLARAAVGGAVVLLVLALAGLGGVRPGR